jgi:hypothetical protein
VTSTLVQAKSESPMVRIASAEDAAAVAGVTFSALCLLTPSRHEQQRSRSGW